MSDCRQAQDRKPNPQFGFEGCRAGRQFVLISESSHQTETGRLQKRCCTTGFPSLLMIEMSDRYFVMAGFLMIANLHYGYWLLEGPA